jgi:dihydrofolate synthase/folylpolyglutamate synthase
MDLTAALRYLDEHVNLEAVVADRHSHPTLERMQRLMHVLGDPQHAAPLVHITGTNGKGSTAQIATRLIEVHGLTVGTYTSPHLQRITERIAVNGTPISDDELGEAIRGVADAEALAGVEPSYFEILTAAAYRWFADVAVDVVVAEVGLLGRWDATNVADGQVAIVTNVELDHTEYAGDSPRLARPAS